MALKALMLRRSIDNKREKLEQLQKLDAQFLTREAQLEAAIDEAENEEQQTAVAQEIEKYEQEKTAHEESKNTLSAEIENLEADLVEIERQTEKTIAKVPTPKTQERMDTHMNMNIRSLPMNVRAFDSLTMEQRETIVQREDVKTFLNDLREAGKQKRAITGGGLTIPVVFLDLIAENMYRYSKLINRVRVRNVRGEARQTIAGTIPEAVWTEMCGAINELTFVFNQVTLDGYKVAGYVPVCNSLLEDSDIELASYIVEMISESIGLAKDKAILYGKGAASKMPMGIVTRLSQTAQPADYPANAPGWADLHTTNLIQIPANQTGAEFWASLTTATSAIANRFARGNKFWAMNSKTLAALQAKAITFTATGAIVAGVSDTLPVVTGDIVILEFMPDYDIVGGYGDLYLWAQRASMSIDLSREVQFIQDNTVFRGKERADGMPVVPQAFVAININGAAPTTSMPFAGDIANNSSLNALNVGAETLTPAFDPAVTSYSVTASAASGVVTATPSVAGAQVAVQYNGKNVKNGSTVTWLADGAAHPMTITVTQGNAVSVYTVNVTKASA